MFQNSNTTVAIVGGGPAGLMAAEVLSNAGVQVDVFDAMPSFGRKFLLAGIGGLNITHSEDYAKFCTRYADRLPIYKPHLIYCRPSDCANGCMNWALKHLWVLLAGCFRKK